MEMKHISASEAKKISSSVIPDADKTLDLIFGEIKLRAGLGQTSFNWPVHENILEQVVKVLRSLVIGLTHRRLMRITKLLLRLAGSEIESTFVFILPLTPHISVAFYG